MLQTRLLLSINGAAELHSLMLKQQYFLLDKR